MNGLFAILLNKHLKLLGMALVAIAYFLTTCAVFAAEDSLTSKSSPDLSYRRVFVPADAPEEWPVGSQRYVPVAHEKFAELLSNSSEQTRGSQVTEVRPVMAKFSAIITEDNLLQGSLDIDVELTDQTPRLLPLAPLNLVVTSSYWTHQPEKPANMGLWRKGFDHNSELGIYVEQSGSLHLEWQLRALESTSDTLQYVLRTLIIAPQTFSITLPANQTASITQANLLSVTEMPDGNKSWYFQLGPNRVHRLSVSQANLPLIEPVLTRVSQETTYHIAAKGLSLLSRFRLEADRQEAEEELQFSLTDGTEILDVKIDQQSVDWQIEKTEIGTFLSFEATASSTPQTIEISALSHIQIDHPWSLPSIRLLNARWAEGAVSIRVPAGLELKSLLPQFASLQHIMGLESVDSETTFRLQEWTEEASYEVIVGKQAEKIRARIATILDLDPADIDESDVVNLFEINSNETTARTVVQLSNQGRPVYQIEGEISQDWSIEAITTIPSNALREWHVYQKDDRQYFRIQLERPLAPNNELQITCDTRAMREDSLLPATAQELIPVRFESIQQNRHLLLLRSQKRGQLKLLHGLDSARLQLNKLGANDAKLLPKSSDGALIDLGKLATDAPINLLPRAAQYRAEAKVEVQVLPDSLVHQYQIDISPTSGIVSDLQVEFDNPLPDSTQWDLAGLDGAVVVQQLEQEGKKTTYLIRLPVALDQTFRLQASYSIPAAETQQCNLIRLSKAETWYGQLVVRGSLDGIHLDDSGWVPITTTAEEFITSTLPSTIGTYRLGPDRAGIGTFKSPLTITRLPATVKTPNLVAWLADIRSLLSSSGTIIHVATYHLENSGATGVDIDLPSAARLQEAWLNEQQLDPHEILTDPQKCRFHFLDNRRYPTITIQYVMQGQELGHSTEIRAQLPRIVFPLESGRWTLWTSEQFMVEDYSNGRASAPLSWTARLLGPLYRPKGEGVFHPFQLEDWQQLWSAKVDVRLARKPAETISQTLADLLESNDKQRWGSILLTLGNETGGEKLLLDRAELESIGIRAGTYFNETVESVSQTSSTPATQTLGPLERCGLSIVTTAKMTILTSQNRVAQWRDQLVQTVTANVYRVSSKSLAARLERTSSVTTGTGKAASGELELVEINSWLAASELTESPWSAPVASLVPDIGRRAITLQFSETPPPVIVKREIGQRALWYAIWLLALVISSRTLVFRLRLFAVIIALTIAICLVVPLNWLVVPQAIFLGLVSSVVLMIFFPRTMPKSLRHSNIRLAAQPVFTICFVVGTLFASYAFAEKPSSKDEKSTTETVHRVLIPVDDEGNLQGEDSYLPEPFLQALLNHQGNDTHDGAQSVLRNVEIRGALPAVASPLTASGENWTVLLEIESFVDNSQIYLPFDYSKASWNSAGHRLNGFPVQVEWEKNRTACTVALEAAGTHHLELSMRPKVTRSANRAHILFPTPAFPGTTLTLNSTTGFSDLSIPTAGKISIDVAKKRLQTKLAATSAMELFWTISTTVSSEEQSFGSVNQLSWLHVEPKTSRLDVKLKLQLTESESRSYLVETSADLRLLPLEEDGVIDSAQYLADRPHTIEIKLKEGIGNDVTLPLQFQLQRTDSIGRVNYPWVQIHNFVRNRSLFAVSVRSGLSYDENLRSVAQSLQATSFLSEWESEQEPPLFAYALTRGTLDGSLRIWPDPQSLSAQQSIMMHCQLTKTLVNYEASINEMTGNWLTYRVRIPKELSVEEIQVRRKSEPTPISTRWNRISGTQLVVMLSQSLHEPHILTLKGHIKTPPDRIITVPNISLADSNRTEMQIEVSRDPQVLVDWVDRNRAPQKIILQGFSRGSSANFVGRFVLRDAVANEFPRLRLERNSRQFEADLVTTLTPSQNSWTGTLHAIAQVRKGLLGQLTFTAPDSFKPPFRIEPVELGSVSEQIDSYGQRQVTVQLQKPVQEGQELALRLIGTISASAEQRLRVPNIQLIGASRVNRYVLLPTQVGNQSIYWDWSDLSPESLPEELKSMLGQQQNTRAFRIDKEQFVAEKLTYHGMLQNAIWRHTLIEGVLDEEGNLSATAELVMQPGRATHCTLRLPPGAKLIQLATGDSRIRREKTPNGTWRIPLGPPYLPRRITVSYQAQVKVSSEQFHLQTPLLLIDDRPLPKPEARWSIRPLGQLVLANPNSGRSISAEQYSRAALQLTLNTIAESRLLALELPFREGRSWFEPWQRRAQQAWQQWQFKEPDSDSLNELSKTAFSSNFVESEPETGEWSALIEKLGQPNSELARREKMLAYPPILPGNAIVKENHTQQYFLSEPNRASFILESKTNSLANGWRWCFAILIIGSTLLLTRHLDNTADWINPLRYRQARLLVILGFVWWMLLTPSFIGLLLMSCSILATTYQRAKRAWQRRARNTGAPFISAVS